MYDFFVALHNVLRWVVVVLGIYVTVRSILGWINKQAWTEAHRKSGVFFTAAVDMQLLVGFLLYFVFSVWTIKPIIEKGMGFVMGQSQYRFFAVEHVFFMLLGVVFAHLGSALPKKVEDSTQKYRRAAIWFGLAIILILAGIPWTTRPLFPGL